MISALNASAQNFLVGVDQIQQRLQTAQTQLTTGLKINNVSDAPVANRRPLAIAIGKRSGPADRRQPRPSAQRR